MLKQKIARIVTEIFNGFTTMALTVVIPILLSDLDRNRKIIYTLMYILIPVIGYTVIKKIRGISDHDITDRKERPPFFVILTILMGIMYFIIRKENIVMLSEPALLLFFATAALTLVTFFWKISGHMTYSTTLFTTLVYISQSPYIFFIFIFTPIIAWTRVVLKKHTVAQVISGTLLTLIISVLIYWVF